MADDKTKNVVKNIRDIISYTLPTSSTLPVNIAGRMSPTNDTTSSSTDSPSEMKEVPINDGRLNTPDNEKGMTFYSWKDEMDAHSYSDWAEMSEREVNAQYKDNIDNWLNDSAFKLLDSHYSAYEWFNQAGVIRIVPMARVQQFTQSMVADIADGVEDPVTQIIPVANVNVIPHHISFDFFDTTEGRFGVSNATEKHMTLECDVYVSELVYFWWQHGSNEGFKGLDDMKQIYTYLDELGEGDDQTKYFDALDKLQDFEMTEDFMRFRSSLFTQFNGWVLKLVGHTFPTFYCVMTDIKYDLSEGETQAKYHLKFEEAIFTGDYSTSGQKPEAEGDSTGGGLDSATNDSNAIDTGDAGVPVDDMQD